MRRAVRAWGVITSVCLLSVLPGSFSSVAAQEDFVSAGPLYDEFRLTLGSGLRKEACGPFWYSEKLWPESGLERTVQPQPPGKPAALPPTLGSQPAEVSGFAFPPFFSQQERPPVEAFSWQVFYPLITYTRFGAERRLQVGQLLSLSGGRNQANAAMDTFTLFPLCFHRQSTDPRLNYTALWPLYGHLEKRLFRDEIDFVLWPAWVKTRQRDVITQNYLVPLVHRRTGYGLTGWQFWPFVGEEHKAITTRTNNVGDLETVPGHEAFFALWPFYFHNNAGLGTTNPVQQRVLLPFYSFQLSPAKDARTYLWPVGPTITDNRGEGFHQVDAPWPVIGFARGPGKQEDRLFPLYSRMHYRNIDSGSILWPLYRYRRSRSESLEIDAAYGMLALFSDVTERDTQTGVTKRRTDLWPLFITRRDEQGNERFQMLALLEPVLPRNDGVVRNYSPLWSLWRSEKNARSGTWSQSFLWNLYRGQGTSEARKCSLLFGLIQYQSSPAGVAWRWLHLFGKQAPPRLATDSARNSQMKKDRAERSPTRGVDSTGTAAPTGAPLRGREARDARGEAGLGPVDRWGTRPF